MRCECLQLYIFTGLSKFPSMLKPLGNNVLYCMSISSTLLMYVITIGVVGMCHDNRHSRTCHPDRNYSHLPSQQRIRVTEITTHICHHNSYTPTNELMNKYKQHHQGKNGTHETGNRHILNGLHSRNKNSPKNQRVTRMNKMETEQQIDVPKQEYIPRFAFQNAITSHQSRTNNNFNALPIPAFRRSSSQQQLENMTQRGTRSLDKINTNTISSLCS